MNTRDWREEQKTDSQCVNDRQTPSGSCSIEEEGDGEESEESAECVKREKAATERPKAEIRRADKRLTGSSKGGESQKIAGTADPRGATRQEEIGGGRRKVLEKTRIKGTRLKGILKPREARKSGKIAGHWLGDREHVSGQRHTVRKNKNKTQKTGMKGSLGKHGTKSNGSKQNHRNTYKDKSKTNRPNTRGAGNKGSQINVERQKGLKRIDKEAKTRNGPKRGASST